MNSPADIRTLDDESLVAQAKIQLPYRTEAYEELMRRHQKKLYTLCLKTVGYAEDAEDITQEVMLKVFHSLKGFAGNSKLSTWLYSIASNACLDHLRKHQQAAIFSAPMYEGEQVPVHDAVDDKIQVDKALAGLDERDRLIINLRYTVGLTLDEIAETLNMKNSAAKMRYYRAMEKLRAILSETENQSAPIQ